MLKTNSFYQDQMEKCRDLAATARNESDREFWLRLAHRWEELMRGQKVVGRPE